jgi:hypothetical protein
MKSMVISHDMIINSIGKSHDSVEIQKLFEALEVSWGDMKIKDVDSPTIRSHESSTDGFSLSFQDISEYTEVPNHDPGDGPFLLHKVSLWGYKKGFNKFASIPIKGVTFESSIEEVQLILGPAIQKAIKGPTGPYVWQYKNYEISMHWLYKPRENSVITYWYKPEE